MPEIPGYRLLEKVASGSSGTVFKAVQVGLDRVVAIKILAPGLFAAGDVRARFLQEARLQAKLSHPNLVQVFDAGFAGSSPYLVTEFVEGGSLGAWLGGKGHLGPSMVARMGAGIAAGLACAHEASIVHRDLKPANVLVGPTGLVKVADFGLAKPEARSASVQTASGVILGTPGYLAWEVLQGARATPAADVYALGLILYELSTGRPLFRGAGVSELLQAQLRCSPSDLARPFAALPAELRRLVGSCLDQAPGSRPSAAEAERALRQLDLDGSALDSPAAKPPARTTVLGQLRPTPGARTTMASRPPQGSKAGRGWADEHRRDLLLGALAGALVLVGGLAVWAGFALLKQADRPSPSAVNVPEAAPARPERPPESAARPSPASEFVRELSSRPLDERLSSGPDRVLLRLTRPAPDGVTVSLRDTVTSRSFSRTLPEGSREAEFTGLIPARAHRLEVSAGGTRTGAAISTLGRSVPSGAAILCSSNTGNSSLAIAAQGERVGLAWAKASERGEQYVLFSESLDGGLTWSAPAKLCPPQPRVRAVALSPALRGFLAAWVTGKKSDGRLVLRWRAEGRAEFGPEMQLPCAAPGLGLWCGDDGVPELLTGEARTGGGQALRWRRWQELSKPPPSGRVVLEDALGWMKGFDFTGRATTRVLLARDSENVWGETRELRLSVFTGQEEGQWPAPVRVVSSTDSIAYPVVCQGREALVILYVVATELRAKVSRDGGRSFTDGKPPIDSGYLSGSEALCLGPGGFLLANVEYVVGTRQDIWARMMVSPDGLGWKTLARPGLPMGLYMGALARPVAGRLVFASITIDEGVAIVTSPLP